MKYYYQIEGQIRNNIGDVLQGMVAKDLLPETDIQVADRECMSDIPADEKALLVANGWYMHSYAKFPPLPNVTPLYVSVHVAQSKLLSAAHVREHFMKNAPIGCRDTKTKKLFLGWGIPAYYSGCLTVTCRKRAEINNSGTGEILLVDNVDHPIPDDIKKKLEAHFNTTLIRISHDPETVTGDLNFYNEAIQKQMDGLLERYCKAKLVITTKIHCALPCLGMGANVMLIHPSPDDPRLDTVNEFIDIVSYEDVRNDNIRIPEVNKKALSERQEFLKNIIKSSVQIQDNAIVKSDSYKSLRAQSSINARIYRILVVVMYKLGIKKEQIQKVYGSGFNG